MKLKNGAVDLTDLAMGIVVLGIVVSIGSSILINVRDSRLTSLSTTNRLNETVTPTDAGVTLSNTWFKSIIHVANITGTPINSLNYSISISPASGVATIRNLTSEFNSAWNVSYSYYDTTRSDWALANNASAGVGEYGNWFKIIVIVGVAAVVLSLIFLAFGKNSNTNY